MAKIIAFSGSAREASYNQKLVTVAAGAARSGGADVTLISLADLPMPLFSEDLERSEGMPENARKFKTLLTESDGFLIASPEYNSAFSPLLKNALDWASRAIPDQPMQTYGKKVAAIMSASPGALGGMRGLVFVRMLLNNLGVMVIPEQVTVPLAHKAFAEDGSIIDGKKHQTIINLSDNLIKHCAK
ncbi:MAG: chromate reductase [Lentisphaeria bacterium]|jgi:chromate reductase